MEARYGVFERNILTFVGRDRKIYEKATSEQEGGWGVTENDGRLQDSVAATSSATTLSQLFVTYIQTLCWYACEMCAELASFE